MHIIPVIDLLNGVVVHAKQGQRHQYQPIQSALTASAKPLDIVKAFNDIYPFDTLYIADLNAIQRLPDTVHHRATIDSILNAFPALTIWLDSGIQHIRDVYTLPGIKAVVGTENVQNIDDYFAMKQALGGDMVLSLDFMPNGYQGPTALIEHNHAWPQSVIVMTLNQVGAQAGVDTTTLDQMLDLASGQHIYAAGGVRHLQDLQQLKAMHVHGALIASALHHKQITSTDLHALSTDTKKPE